MQLGISPEECSFENYIKSLRQKCISTEVIKNRKYPSIWVNDSLGLACTNCNYVFNWVSRKHHCRSCGCIFCNDCCTKEVLLPKGLEVYPTEPKTNAYYNPFKVSVVKHKKKVCNKCFADIEILLKHELLIIVFSYMSINEWKIVAVVSKKWYTAVCICKSKFREIQAVPPNCSLSQLQERMLMVNADWVIGHSKYMIKLLIQEGTLRIPNSLLSCIELMCDVTCNKDIQFHELMQYKLQVVGTKTSDIIQNKIQALSHEEFEVYLPQIVSRYKSWKLNLIDLLITRSSALEGRISIFWCLAMLKNIKVASTEYEQLLKEYITAMYNKYGAKAMDNELFNGRNIFKMLSKIPVANIRPFVVSLMEGQVLHDTRLAVKMSETDTCENSNKSIPYPFIPSKYLLSLNTYGIEVKKSNSSPMLVSFTCTDGSVESVLVKRDFMFRDHIITNIILLMDVLLKRDLKIDFGIKTYKVLVISPYIGIIQVVKNAETLGSIKHKIKTTITNYLLNNNQDRTVADIREKFIKSTAAYCTITYLLGIGDRHLDNILLTKDGYLLHIDYGFILGRDPKPALAPSIRITEDIVDAFGGSASVGYENFKTYCVNIYNCLRKYYWLFENMLSEICDDSVKKMPDETKEEWMTEELLKRFMPYENDQTVGPLLLSKIDKSYKSESYTTKISDTWHYYAKNYSGYVSSGENKE